MPSKPLRSWSKRQPGSETSSRTNGLLPTLKHQASRLVLLPSDHKQNASSPVKTQYDTALANAVDRFHIAVNGMLNSRSSSVRQPPRSRPRSTSAPSMVELPAELPGSTFLEDRGQPSSPVSVSTRPSVETTYDESPWPEVILDYEADALDISHTGAPKIVHTRSILGRGSSYSSKKKNHTNNMPLANETDQSITTGTKTNNSFTFGPILQKSPDSKAMKTLAVIMRTEVTKGGNKKSGQNGEIHKNYIEATCSEPSPTTEKSDYASELESATASQVRVIPELQARSCSPSKANESHVNALKRWHSVQIASFETQARLFRERTNKHGVQDNHSMHTPVLSCVGERPSNLESANVDTISCSVTSGQQLPPQRLPFSPEMNSLEHKLLGTPELEPIAQYLLSEPSLYEQDRAALQKLVDSLAAKLNNSNKYGQGLRNTLGTIRRESADKTMHTKKLAEKIQSLYDTVAHLEGRLEDANMKRLDAEEQLLAWREHKSPFELMFSEQHPSTDTNHAALDTQTDTGNNRDSPNTNTYTLGIGCSGKNTLATLVARIEELQTQAKEKDACIAQLERKLELLQENYCHLQHEHKRVSVQLDLQHELLQETRPSDKLIEQLRTAVIGHESTIMENEQTIYLLRRQLEHHKLLLKAEIRRHAAIKLYVDAEGHSLPELTSLAKREDIDCWIERLHERLRREQSENKGKAVVDTAEAKIQSLRHEIDFYVREIILFKLDIKGYRSDIRKMKDMAAQQGSCQKLPDMESKPSSSKRAASPVESTFAPITPELDDFLGVSPVMDHADTASSSEKCSVTTSPSARLLDGRTGGSGNQLLELEIAQDIPSSTCDDSSTTNKLDRVDSAFSPSSSTLQVWEHPARSDSFGHVYNRSMSAPPQQLYQQPIGLDRPPIGEKHTTSKAECEAESYRRCIAMPDASELSLNSQLGLSQLMDGHKSSEEAVPSLSDYCERPVACMVPKSPVESLSEVNSIVSTASDYLGAPVPLSEDALGNITALGVPVKAFVEPPRKLAYIVSPTLTHVRGCSITRCAQTDAGLSQPGTGSTADSSTTSHSHTNASRKEVSTKVESQDTPTISFTPDVEAGVVLDQGQNWYLSLPNMASHMRRQSASSIYSVDSCHKLAMGTKSEVPMRVGKIH